MWKKRMTRCTMCSLLQQSKDLFEVFWLRYFIRAFCSFISSICLLWWPLFVIVTLTLFLVYCCSKLMLLLFVWSYLDAIRFTYSYILLLLLSFTILQMQSCLRRQPSVAESPKVRIITRYHHLSRQPCDPIRDDFTFECMPPQSDLSVTINHSNKIIVHDRKSPWWWFDKHYSFAV